MDHQVLRAQLDPLVAQLELQVQKMDVGALGRVRGVDLANQTHLAQRASFEERERQTRVSFVAFRGDLPPSAQHE